MTPSSSEAVKVVPVAFHSTIPTRAPLGNSATTSDVQDRDPPSSSDGGSTRQIRTAPSRLPVAMRWYERPHDGAQDTQVRGEDEAVLRNSNGLAVWSSDTILATGELPANAIRTLPHAFSLHQLNPHPPVAASEVVSGTEGDEAPSSPGAMRLGT